MQEIVGSRVPRSDLLEVVAANCHEAQHWRQADVNWLHFTAFNPHSCKQLEIFKCSNMYRGSFNLNGYK